MLLETFGIFHVAFRDFRQDFLENLVQNQEFRANFAIFFHIFQNFDLVCEKFD